MKKSMMKIILAIIGILALINACQPENLRINEAEIQETKILDAKLNKNCVTLNLSKEFVENATRGRK